MAERNEPADARFRLLLRQCATCDSSYYPPRSLCPRCGTEGAGLLEGSGGGTVWSAVAVHRTSQEHLRTSTPYTIGVVRLPEGAHVLAFLESDTSSVATTDDVRFDEKASQQRGALVFVRPTSEMRET